MIDYLQQEQMLWLRQFLNTLPPFPVASAILNTGREFAGTAQRGNLVLCIGSH
jgi:hypothetical protein